MNRRILVFALLVSIMAPAHASFELMLVLDAGDGSNPARVHRFDATTGTYFGSFGVGDFTGPTTIAVNTATGKAYIGASGEGTMQYNYNTGELERIAWNFWLNYGGFIDPSSGRLAFANASFVSTVNLSSGSQAHAPVPAGGFARWGCVAQDGSVYWGDSTAGNLYRGANASVSPTLIGSIGAAKAPPTYCSAAASLDSSGQRVLTFHHSDLLNRVTRIVLSDATTIASSIAFDVPSLASVRGVAPSHVGTYAVGVTAGGAFLSQHIRASGALGKSFTNALVKNPVDCWVVVAPEPGSVVALAVGGLAVLVQRRRR